MDAMFFPGTVDVLEREGMDGFIRAWEERRRTPVDPATRSAFSKNDAQALAAYFRRSDREPGIGDETLAGIDVPVLAVVGSDDRLRVEDTRALSRTVPGARLAILRGGGPCRDGLGRTTCVENFLSARAGRKPTDNALILGSGAQAGTTTCSRGVIAGTGRDCCTFRCGATTAFSCAARATACCRPTPDASASSADTDRFMTSTASGTDRRSTSRSDTQVGQVVDTPSRFSMWVRTVSSTPSNWSENNA